MFFRSEQVEEDIVLRANAHGLSSSIHLFKNVITEQRYSATAAMYQTSEHRDSCGLASAVMAKQAEDLIGLHLHIESINRLEAIIVLLSQVFDLEEMVRLLFDIHFRV